MTTDQGLRRTRLIAWTIVLAAVLVIGGWISGDAWLSFVAGLLKS
jgi:hypothetical protein